VNWYEDNRDLRVTVHDKGERAVLYDKSGRPLKRHVGFAIDGDDERGRENAVTKKAAEVERS
jgi:hypothetical protein